MEKKELFTTDQAAKYLGGTSVPLSVRTLEAWRVQGYGPTYVKLGKLVRYKQSSLDDWVESQARQNTSQEGFCHAA